MVAETFIGSSLGHAATCDHPDEVSAEAKGEPTTGAWRSGSAKVRDQCASPPDDRIENLISALSDHDPRGRSTSARGASDLVTAGKVCTCVVQLQ